jgi:hypothetical protein
MFLVEAQDFASLPICMVYVLCLGSVLTFDRKLASRSKEDFKETEEKGPV